MSPFFSRSTADGFSTVAGDSGAWVIDNDEGRVCGHVLAWCSRNKWAYICPMEILFEDMKRTLPARTIELPGASHDASLSERVECLDRKAADVERLEQQLPSGMNYAMKGMQGFDFDSPSSSSSSVAVMSDPELAERSANLHNPAVLRDGKTAFARTRKGLPMEGQRVTGQMAKG